MRVSRLGKPSSPNHTMVRGGSRCLHRILQRLGSAAERSSMAGLQITPGGVGMTAGEVIGVDGQLDVRGGSHRAWGRLHTMPTPAHSMPPIPVASPALPTVAPVVPPMTDAQLQLLVDAIADGGPRVVALTGAGCSTEAGIPDYRGPGGAYTRHGFKPMTHQQFMAGPAQRARYFARSFVGWHEFANSQPAGAHLGLSRLIQNGWVSHIITQNVDRLHQKAATPPERVLELHGTTHVVRCLQCGSQTCRHALQQRLAALNPATAELAARLAAEAQELARAQMEPSGRVARARPSTEPPGPAASARLVPVRRPDGDVELQDAGQGFVVPPCADCGGVLKPDVVFFGDNIPKERVELSLALASQADTLLVVGSSLTVYSAFRLVEACRRGGGRVVLVNCGQTRADGVADMKLEVLAGEAMMRTATHPRMLLPRSV